MVGVSREQLVSNLLFLKIIPEATYLSAPLMFDLASKRRSVAGEMTVATTAPLVLLETNKQFVVQSIC